jgi:hypothetical protein|uniref:Uncharacterized protein n=1 Tax=Zea mays TaxID=4577 RepID=C0PA81_MAIZE|nr:unknown [Zea mays]
MQQQTEKRSKRCILLSASKLFYDLAMGSDTEFQRPKLARSQGSTWSQKEFTRLNDKNVISQNKISTCTKSRSCPLVELWLVNWLPHIITKHRSRLSMWHIAYVLCPRMQTTECARRPNLFAADYCRNGPCFTQLKMDHNMM